MNRDIHAPASAPAELLFTSALLHPDDVLASAELSEADKRAMLAGWASDRNAVPGEPALRRIPSGAVVPVETILCALRKLDRAKAPAFGDQAVLWHWPLVKRARLATKWRQPTPRRKPFDDDDDPPPCPVTANVPPRLPSTDAVALVAA